MIVGITIHQSVSVKTGLSIATRIGSGAAVPVARRVKYIMLTIWLPEIAHVQQTLLRLHTVAYVAPPLIISRHIDSNACSRYDLCSEIFRAFNLAARPVLVAPAEPVTR